MKKEDCIGKMCPFCKTVLKENDDIVVCSNCDMPHHKECWVENGGCTTFGCMGTITNLQSTDDYLSLAESIRQTTSDREVQINKKAPAFCFKCGARRNATSKYCRICGVQFRTIT